MPKKLHFEILCKNTLLVYTHCLPSTLVHRYFIFFSPLDICYFLCAAAPVHLLLYTVEEFGRAKKVLSGVTMASELYPQSMVAMAIVGMLKGMVYVKLIVMESDIFYLREWEELGCHTISLGLSTPVGL